MTQQKIIMDKSDIDRTLNRIALELWEHNRGAETFAFIGIRRRGVTIANRLSRKLQEFTGVRIPVGALDITLYRDDLSEIASHPVLKKTEIPFPIKGTKIYLCDDVMYTGRNLTTAKQERVEVQLEEDDGIDQAFITGAA